MDPQDQFTRIASLKQPDALKKEEPLMWSPGKGTDVWEMFCAAISGDIEKVSALLDQDPSLFVALTSIETR
jgi:hypothetical protein